MAARLARNRRDRKWRLAVAFGATSFASACLNNIFVTYYIDFFTEVERVPARWPVIMTRTALPRPVSSHSRAYCFATIP